MPRDPKLAAAVAMLKVAGRPTRTLLLLELADGPRDTTDLAEAAGRNESTVSRDLTSLRLAALVETTKAGQRRVHALTPAGRTLAEAIRKLSG
jgi:DNA-binding transcriptional ArsR family regulator